MVHIIDTVLGATIQHHGKEWDIVNNIPAGDLEPRLLTWFDFNPGMDKQLHPS